MKAAAFLVVALSLIGCAGIAHRPPSGIFPQTITVAGTTYPFDKNKRFLVPKRPGSFGGQVNLRCAVRYIATLQKDQLAVHRKIEFSMRSLDGSVIYESTFNDRIA
jgi:hypothetical protein